MLIPLGILAASSAAGGSYELLETVSLGSSQASIVFSNLASSYASTYQHLQLRATIRSARSSNTAFSILRMNSDTAGNYSNHYLRGNGSTVTSAADPNSSYIHFGDNSAANATSGIYSAVVCDILDPFETSKFKTTRTLSGVLEGGTNFVQLWSGNWRNTNQLTTLTITDFFGANLGAGTRVSLYGLKAS